MVIAGLLLPSLPTNVEELSGCMFGVYLVHIAALGVFNRVTGPDSFVTPVLVFILASLWVWLARKTIPVTLQILG